MAFDTLRFHFRAWRYRYKLDSAEINFILRTLQPGDACVDIGAHKGGYTYWMRKAVGERGRVYSFEPQPALASYLRRMKGLLRMENVTLEECALSSEPGELMLSIPGSGPSPSATLEQGSNAAGTKQRVEVRTLDSYFASKRSTPVKFIKCDVEGHELDVFRGAEKLLRADKPVLLFECEERHHTRYSSRDVFDFLKGMGYHGFFFTRGALQPLREFSPQTHGRHGDPQYVNNFVFTMQPAA
jgi:FkbM family methyltransferase